MSTQVTNSGLLPDERRFLAEAAQFLEYPSFLTRVARVVGKPAEALLAMLPEAANKLIAAATHRAMLRGVEWVSATISGDSHVGPPRRWPGLFARHGHTAVSALSGAGGGFFGLAGLTVEIPVTTLVMLRSIASIAAASGADLSDPRTRLECLAVLSLGTPADKEMQSTYLSARLGTSLAVREAAGFLAKTSAEELSEAIAKGSAPILVRLVEAVGTRFQIVVTEKVAAQMVPVVGAAMGALVNASFTDYFNRIARYHFGIVALERRYGQPLVDAEYLEACQNARKVLGLRS
ncbi:MAG TPA: EcsC family protein [Pirellulales bacterium]|nr:EcsC family protein [Pirellulales bacterium]